MTDHDSPAQVERVPAEYLRRRQAAAAARLVALDLDSLAVTAPAQKGYLSGFTTGVNIAPGGAVLVTRPGREDVYVTGGTDYLECRTALEPEGFIVHPYYYARGQNVHTELGTMVGRLGLRRVGVEAKYTTAKQLGELEAVLAPHGAAVVVVGEVVDPLREVKDAWEVEQIRRAVAVSGAALAGVLELVRPGVSEWDLAVELERRLVAGGTGSPRVAFQSIVASGPRSALPHGAATRRVLAAGDLLTFDFGATVNGYCADVTRTVCVGPAGEQQRRVYEAVVRAKDAAIALMLPGRARRDSAAAAASVIEDYGLERYLAHGTGGHGIGLEVHEGPSTSSDGEWVAGNVCTLEPGLYIPGWGGVRVEDDVLITGDGQEILTRAIECGRLLEL